LAIFVALCAMAQLFKATLVPSAWTYGIPLANGAGLNTMMCLLVCALGLWSKGKCRWVSGYVVVLLASTVIVQTWAGIYPMDGIWRLLINTQSTPDGGWSGRMSFISAWILTVLGVLLVTMDRVRSHIGVVLYQMLTCLVVVVSFLMLYGHSLAYISFTAPYQTPLYMSWSSAICTLLLGVGVACAFAQTTVFYQFYDRREDRQIFSAMLIVVLLLTLAAGADEIWVALEGLHGFKQQAHDMVRPFELERHRNIPTAILLLLGTLGAILLVRQVRSIVRRLQHQESLMQQVMQLLPVGVGIADKAGKIIYRNPAAHQIWEAYEIGGVEQVFQGWWHGSGSPIAPTEWPLARAIRNGETSIREIIDILNSSGGRKTLLNSALPLHDGSGAISGAVAVNQDITDNLKMADELLRHKEFFQIAFDQAAIGIVIFNLDGDFIQVNEAFSKLVGYSKAALIGMSFAEVSHAEDYPAIHRMMQRLLAGEVQQTPVERQFRHRSGHPIWGLLSVAVARDEENRPLHLIGQVIDISERRQLIHELQRWHDVFRHANWGVAVGSADGSRIELMNPEFARMLGYTVEELTGRPVSTVFAPESRESMFAHLQRAHAQGHYIFETMHIRKDGSVFPVEADISVVYSDRREVLYRVVNVKDISQRKAAELALRASESRLNEAEQIAHLGSWDWDIATGEQIWSDESYRIFGLTPGVDRASYDQFMHSLTEDDQRYIKEQVHLALHDGLPYSVEYRIVRPDGTVRHVQSQAQVQRDQNGVPVRMVGTNLDVTELKYSQQALVASEAKLRGLFELAPLGIALADMQGRFIEFNEAFETICGYPAEELKCLDYWTLTPNQYAVLEAQQLESLMTRGQYGPYEKTYVRKDGTSIPVRLNGMLMKGRDGQDYIWSMIEDITVSREVQSKLHESQKRLQAITNHLPGVVFQLEESLGTGGLHFIYINEGTETLFGVEPQSLITDPMVLYRYLHPDDVLTFDASRWQALDHMQVWDWEGRVCSTDQPEKWVNVRAMPQRKGDDDVVWDGVILNINQTKQAEFALSESRQMLRELAAEDEAMREAERKRIAREVHDELGQTLTALRMDVSLLRIRFGSHDAALMEKVQGMTELVDRAIQSVRNVATNLRPAALDMGVVSALEWLCDEFTEHTGVPCVLHSSAETFTLDEGRAVAIFRIVQESLTNVARYAEASYVGIAIERRGEDLSIVVRDNGQGFDQSATTTRKSFGLLGMRERAIALGGDVDVISAPGQGTTISVLIPMNGEKRDD